MSFYNLNGTVVEIKGAEDLYFHDVLRIPNWPTEQAARQHLYHLNATQDAAVIAAGITLGAASGATAVGPTTGGSQAVNTDLAVGKAGQNLAHDANPFNFALGATGIAAWFARGLKVVFGGILIVAGIIKMTGTDKTLNQVLPLVGGPAGKVLKV